MNSLPFIPGPIEPVPQPLEEYLPQIPSSLYSTWLNQTSGQDQLHLDPFGSSPQVLLEAARSGFRILVSINNPILRFLLTYMAENPTPSELQAALAELASTYKGEERLEPHILSLYETECPHCGKTISARAFIWKKKSATPERKICHCQHCSQQGEYPTSAADVEKAKTHRENSLYHARALTRVAPPDDPIRAHAENALRIYTPRAVYALFTLVNKLSGLSPSHPARDHISALLLHAFYAGSSLWSAGESLRKPHKLSPPRSYLERNIWACLEEAIEIWDRPTSPVPITRWPERPPENGGISLYPGRFKDLAQAFEGSAGSGVMVVPQPDPTFWSLSALWAGWLWGQDQAAPLRQTLTLRDPDWPWHTQALENAFSTLAGVLSSHSPAFSILTGLSSQFLTSTLVASHSAGFRVQNIAVEPHRKEGQITWGRLEAEAGPPTSESLKAILRNAGYTHLSERGEPSYSLLLQAAGLTALNREGALPRGPEMAVPDVYHKISTEMEETYAYRQGFLHYPESDTWWHQELAPDISPLADEVEKEVVQHLLGAENPLQEAELERRVYTSFPGLLTPSAELIQACLASYAKETPPGSGRWIQDSQETPAARREDMEEMKELLEDLGRRLSFTVHTKAPRGNVGLFTWQDSGEDRYTFFVSASGLLGKLILFEPEPPPNPWIVLPGSRAHLVVHKLSQNQPLAQKVEENWGFLKYRHLRRLAGDESLTRDNIEERFRLDPLKYDAPQLPLI